MINFLEGMGRVMYFSCKIILLYLSLFLICLYVIFYLKIKNRICGIYFCYRFIKFGYMIIGIYNYSSFIENFIRFIVFVMDFN